MDYTYIEQLLERYWRCETSVEEEQVLRVFFAKGDHVPEHLQKYKKYFGYASEMCSRDCLGEDFSERIMATIHAPHVKARHITLWAHMSSLYKVAASIALLYMLGNGLHAWLFSTETMKTKAAETAATVANTEQPTIKQQQITMTASPAIDTANIQAGGYVLSDAVSPQDVD